MGKIKIALFSGGSGTESITNEIVRMDNIDLSIIVNAYDDGHSTGVLRDLVNGMLGPSDIRKNIQRLISPEMNSSNEVKKIINFRFGKDLDSLGGKEALKEIAESSFANIAKLGNDVVNILDDFKKYIQIFLEFISDKEIDFSDFSLGNILFTGCFIQNGSDFNKTIEEFSNKLLLKGAVFNVTEGENLILAGIKKDGEILKRESEIVSPQSDVEIEDIFLLERAGVDSREGWIKEQVFPKLNGKVKDVLEKCDVIIYGGGTQFSSLFPSYLTDGLAKAIKSNKAAKKIYLGNLKFDNDILGENINTLIDKFFYYMNLKGKYNFLADDLVTDFFVDEMVISKQDGLTFLPDRFKYLDKLTISKFSNDRSNHSGKMILKQILS